VNNTFISPCLDQGRWERFFIINGYIFFIVIGLGWVINLWSFWDPGLSAQATADYFAANRTRILISAASWQIGMQAMLLWNIALAFNIWRLEGGNRMVTIASIASGLTVPYLMMAAGGLLAVAAYRPLESPDVTRAMADAFVWIADIFWPPVSAQMAFTGWIILRSQDQQGALPAWSGWLGIIVAPLEMLLWGCFFTMEGPFRSNGLLGYWFPTVGWGLWALGLTIAMHRTHKVSGRNEAAY